VPLTPTGLTVPTYAESLAEIHAAIRASPALNPNGRVLLDETSVLGVIAAIVASKHAELNELVLAVYASAYKASAEGDALDALAALIGVVRAAAASSTTDLSFTGTDGTIIPSGTRFSDAERTDLEWITVETVTIVAGVAVADAQASITGPVAANAGTIEKIITPVAGLTTVTNVADARAGRDIQTDESLRQTMDDLLYAVGSGTTGAIRSAVLAVPGVLEGFVFENVADATNSFGVPPHNVEVVVDGGLDEDLAQAIYDNKAAGTGTYSATGDGDWAVDINGEDVAINWSRPIDVLIWVYVEIETNGDNTTVSDDSKTAAAAFGNELAIGAKVRRSRFIHPIEVVSSVTNVLRVGVSKVDAAGALAAANLDGAAADIVMAFREKARFSTARITVAVV